MALRVKAVERLLKFDKESAGKYRYVMKPELYTSLDQKKVIRETNYTKALKNVIIPSVFRIFAVDKSNKNKYDSTGGYPIYGVAAR